MKLLLVCLFLIAATRPASSESRRGLDIFEFGENVGHVSFSASGSITTNEKLKNVHVVIPECEDLEYIRVDINDQHDPPEVTFDWDSFLVSIKYEAWQYSKSQYKIIAKSSPSVKCNLLKPRSSKIH